MLSAHFQQEGIQVDYIDLSVPGRVYYRPAIDDTSEAEGQEKASLESGG
jgi:hypothetical protein